MAGRWGSFISGLESKLDTILADEDTTLKSKEDGATSEQPEKKTALAVPTAPKGRAAGHAGSTSSNRAQDRLNERLAKALATRTTNTGDNSAATSKVPSRTSSPVNTTVSPRMSNDVAPDISLDHLDKPASPVEPGTTAAEKHKVLAEGITTSTQESTRSATSPERHPEGSSVSQATKLSLDTLRGMAAEMDTVDINGVRQDVGHDTPAEYQQTIQQMKSDYEAAEIQRQEETHEYLERIDALQSKLRYLTREATKVASHTSSTAEYGSTEQQLAAKDEKIALLMEEGHKLSQTELKHMGIIKRLRAKSVEDERQLSEIRRQVEKDNRAAREAQERAKKADAAERRATEKAKSLQKLERDLDIMRAERDTSVSLIASLRNEVSEARKAAEEADTKAQGEALELERKRAASLADEVSRIQMEKEIGDRNYLAEIRELKEKVERDKERARAAEIERQGEQNILESRLEAFRAKAEEASAGSTGDLQTKLIRQIETLQNQYAVASENWQGIEGSLLARVGALEKEKDDASKREADVRRKSRQTHLKSRRVEDELERATTKAQDLQHELKHQSAQLTSLREKLSRAEADAVEARSDLQAEREIWKARQAQRVEEEKGRQREVMSRTPDAPYQQFRADSPVTSSRNRKGSNPDRHSPHGRRYHGLAIAGAPVERPASRHSSTQPLPLSDIPPLSRQGSALFTNPSSVNGTVPETPSITMHDQDDFFDSVRTPASPEHTINDIISASTGGAGPSVQLVERMSAAVRRLESEKASSKDELARLSQQRDEAREQVVSLMQEAEEKRRVDERSKVLEKENQGIRERYLTTLEMLGEKSEKVEELKADVTDLKQMYRELVDSTMR